MATLAFIPQLEEHESRYEFTRRTTLSHIYCVISTIIFCDSSYYTNIYSYLHNQSIHDNLTCNQKHLLICNTSHYTLISSDTYRMGLDGTLLRYLERGESKHALAEVHEGLCGSHYHGLVLA